MIKNFSITATTNYKQMQLRQTDVKFKFKSRVSLKFIARL